MSTSAIDLSAGLEPVSQSGDGGIDLSAGLEGVSTGPVNPYAHEAPTPPQEITDPLGLKNKPVWDQSTLPSPAAGMRQGGNAAEQEFNAQDKTPSELGWLPQVRPAPRNAAEQIQQTTQAPLKPVAVPGKTDFALQSPGVQHPDLDQMRQDLDSKVQAFLKANPTYKPGGYDPNSLPNGPLRTAVLKGFSRFGISQSDVDGYLEDHDAAHYHPVENVKQMGRGLADIGESYEQRSEANELMQAHPGLSNEDANRAIAWKYGKTPISRLAEGGTEAMSGAMGLGTPAIAAGVAEAPFKAALEYGAGVLAGKGVAEAAKAAGASPEVQEAANVAGFFIPSFMTGAAGLRSGGFPEGATVRDPVTGKEVPVRGGVVGGKGFAAGVARSDTGEYSAQARVGPYSFKAKWGRNVPGEPEAPGTPQISGPEQPPPTASEIQQKAQQATVDETAARAAQIQEKAAQIAGLAPPPPPPPKPGEPGSGKLPSPAGMDQGNLTQQTVETAGKVIQSLPAQKRFAALLEAVGNLAKWIFGKKTFVGPDNKVVTVDSPKAAQSEAVNLVNAEVDRQAEQAKEQQQNQQKAIEQQAKDADKAQQEIDKQALANTEEGPAAIPDTPGTQLARRRLLQAPPTATAKDLEKIVRDLPTLISAKTRQDLVQEEISRRANIQEDQAQAAMTGKPVPPEESRTELQAKADAVIKGEEPFVHIPANVRFVPNGVDDLQHTKVNGAGKLSGMYHHSDDITSAEIRTAARELKNDPDGEAKLAERIRTLMPVEVGESDLEPESPAEPEQPTQNLSTPQLEHAAKEGENHSSEGQNTPKTSESAEQRKSELETQKPEAETKPELRVGQKIRFTAFSGEEMDGIIKAFKPNGQPVVLTAGGHRTPVPLDKIIKEGPAEEAKPGIKVGDQVQYESADGYSAGIGKLISLNKDSATIEKERDGRSYQFLAKLKSLKPVEPRAPRPEAAPEPSKPTKAAIIPTRAGVVAVPIHEEPEPQEEEPEQEPAPKPAELPAPVEAQDGSVHSLVNSIYGKLEAGESLGNVTELTKLAEQHFGSSRTSGQWTPKDMFDAMEAAANRYIIQHGARWMEMEPKEALTEIRGFLDKLTSQGTRTDEQIKLQQFSTPPTESYLAAIAAKLTPQDVVLEPSAGNGGIAAWPKSIGAEVHVNEIAERRQDMLREAGFNEPTAHNGEVIHAVLDQSVKPSVILMNPPFSAGALGGRNRNVYGFNHVDSALQRLQKGGRLVAILGGGQANEPNGGASLVGGASGEWFKKLAKQYNIRANIRINGKEYQKYGTSFATRIIVIDKDGPTKSLDDVIRQNVDTLEEAYDALKPVIDSRPELESGARAGDQTSLARPQAGSGMGQRAGSGSRGSRGAISGGGANTPAVRPLDDVTGIAGNARPDDTGGRPESPVDSAAAHRPEQNPADELANSPAGGGGDIHPVGRAGEPGSKLNPEAKIEQVTRAKSPEQEDSSAYVVYQPSIKGGAHPGTIVESKTMATVPLPKLEYLPSLPKETIEGKLSAVQLEPVILTGQANEQRLPGTNARATMLIGDGTGLGKGREAAGIIFDNWNKGRKRLVWVSQNADLKKAAKRDLANVGAPELADKIEALQEYKGDEDINHSGVLYTTYALLRSADKKGNTRSAQIQKWLRGDDDGEGGFILFDESHNLKNAVVGQGGTPSQQGLTVKKLLEDNPNLRTANLSATAASDVMNLGYLDRLGLWGPGTAFPGGFWSFVNEIGSGGISAMELVARELKAQGRYISRSLSFKGVTFDGTADDEIVKLSPEQKALYRTATRAWAAVYDSVENAVHNITNGGARQKSRFMSQFQGTQQRFFNVLLTTLKIPALIPKIEKDLADGKSVVITLVNTNEAAQNREKTRVASDTTEDEDEIPDYDFGPSEMLISLVHDYFPTQQYADGVDDQGRPIKVPVVDDEGNPVHNPDAIAARDQLEADLKRDLKMPANPLDILIQSLGGPTKVAELTGRKEYFDDNKGEFIPRGDKGSPRKEVNQQEQAKFQSGKKRVAVLSNAAGTGIDLHASLQEKNQQKRSHYQLQAGWSADKAMQMFGRTHRTDQASAPEYHLVTSDMGGEKRFIATIAKRLGSLNAISKGQQDAGGGVDIMSKVNFESEQGRQATDAFYRALLTGEDVPEARMWNKQPDGSEVSEPVTGMEILRQMHVLKQGLNGLTVPDTDRTNVTRLLNRILALDPDLQNAVYDYYFDIFTAIVQRAIEDGSLDTGVKELPGDEHRVVSEKTLATDPNTGAKTTYSKIETKMRNERIDLEGLEKRMKQYPDAELRIHVMPRSGDQRPMLVRKAPVAVHANGSTEESVYVAEPGKGKWAKVSKSQIEQTTKSPEEIFGKEMIEANDELGYAKRDVETYENAVKRNPADRFYSSRLEQSKQRVAIQEAKIAELKAKQRDPIEQAKEMWAEHHAATPSHHTTENHVIGGAVLRWWAPIRETSTGRMRIVTALDKDSGQRVVGVQIPADRISRLETRISGATSTMTGDTLSQDVLRNGTEYRLEGNIRVLRGRIAGRPIVRLAPPSFEIQENLKSLGVVYERGIQPVFYIPSGGQGDAILDRVLKQYPIVPEEKAQGPDTSGATMSAFGVGYLDPLAKKVLQPVVDYAKKAFAATWNEALTAAGRTGKGARNIGRELVAVLYPAALAETRSLNIMGSALGEPQLRLYEAGQFLYAVDRMFDQMSPDGWTSFVDAIERGDKQPTPELDQAAEMLKAVLEAQREREQAAINLDRKGREIELSDKANYFPHRYRKAPGRGELPSENDYIQSIVSNLRRPFEGSKSFMKIQRYTYKQAVEEGAEPIGNPVQMVLKRLQEGAKFVGARYAIHNFKDQGIMLFRKRGKPMPAGFALIKDKFAQVWRVIESTEENLNGENRTFPVQTGDWVMQENAARLLNNYLSVDHIRGSEVGNAFIKLKNLTTEIRLAISAFHWLYITAENVASGLQQGLDKFYNMGVRRLDPAAMADGAAEIGRGIVAPYTAIKVGGQMIQYARNPEEFLQSKEGKEFVERYPDYAHLMELLFRGGLRWQLADTFQQSFGAHCVEAWKAGEMGKGLGKLLPWLAHGIAKPLFEHYIPRSKWAFAVELLSKKLAQYSYAIEQGTKTEEEIAREVAATTDNRFGELNWDSLYLNNNMRTAMQFFWRSATWKLGSWRGAVKAGKETFTSEAFDDRIFELMDAEAKKNPGVVAELRRGTSRLPQMGVNAGWVVSMMLTVAMVGAPFEYMATGKFPWQWAKNAHNSYGYMGNTALESMHPRTGEVDAHGEPIRLSFPTGLKDYEHGFENPTNYLKGSESDVVSNALDTLTNEDAFGNYVFNPQDPTLVKFWQGLKYNAAGDFEPMSVSNFTRSYGPQDVKSKLLRSTGVVGGAPRSLDRSHALTLALSLRRPHTAMTPEAQQDYEERQYLKETSPTPREERQMEKDKNLDYLQRVVLYQLSYPDAIKVYNDPKITPEEKAKLADIVERKQYNWERQQAKNERTVK